MWSQKPSRRFWKAYGKLYDQGEKPMIPIPGKYSGQLTRDELAIQKPAPPPVEVIVRPLPDPTPAPCITDDDAKGLEEEDDNVYPAYLAAKGILTLW